MDPDGNTVTLHRLEVPESAPRVLAAGETLTSAVLAGLALPLAGIFA